MTFVKDKSSLLFHCLCVDSISAVFILNIGSYWLNTYSEIFTLKNSITCIAAKLCVEFFQTFKVFQNNTFYFTLLLTLHHLFKCFIKGW